MRIRYNRKVLFTLLIASLLLFGFIFTSQIFKKDKNVQIYYSSSVNEPPIARITVDKTEADIGEFINFSAEKSRDPDGEIVDYKWDFGDNSEIVHGKEQKHFYARSGEYTVTLTVEDSNQTKDKEQIEVSIKPKDEPHSIGFGDYIFVVGFIAFVIFGMLFFIAIVMERFGKKFPVLHKYIPEAYKRDKGSNN
jgi:hypothetical protein